MKKSLLERFTEKYSVVESGCWIWTGSKHWEGYGQIFVDGKLQTSHRVSYRLFVGTIPSGTGAHGTVVCHRCDNRACVNPAHLFIGTQKDNVRDAQRKGILQRGARNGQAKLTEAIVVAIRADARLQREIAADYGISQQRVSEIKRRVIWRYAERDIVGGCGTQRVVRPL